MSNIYVDSPPPLYEELPSCDLSVTDRSYSESYAKDVSSEPCIHICDNQIGVQSYENADHLAMRFFCKRNGKLIIKIFSLLGGIVLIVLFSVLMHKLHQKNKIISDGKSCHVFNITRQPGGDIELGDPLQFNYNIPRNVFKNSVFGIIVKNSHEAVLLKRYLSLKKYAILQGSEYMHQFDLSNKGFSINFTELAHGNFLEIYYSCRRTEVPPLIWHGHNLWHRSVISLHQNPDLQFTISPKRYEPGDVIVFNCSDMVGFPKSYCRLVVNGQAAASGLQRISYNLTVTKDNHNMLTVCKCGNASENVSIVVNHGPSSAYVTGLSTPFSRNGTLTCIGRSGYPETRQSWHIIESPITARQNNYKIEDNVLKLSISSNLTGRWIFQCVSENSYGRAVKNVSIVIPSTTASVSYKDSTAIKSYTYSVILYAILLPILFID